MSQVEPMTMAKCLVKLADGPVFTADERLPLRSFVVFFLVAHSGTAVFCIVVILIFVTIVGAYI